MARAPDSYIFLQCLNTRCPVTFFPVEVTDNKCPNCDLTGIYSGVAARPEAVQPVEEEPD